MRRVLLHLGLHKTGTTAAQSFLYENRELIWPHFSLVLPYKTRKTGLAAAATRHSVYRLDDTLKDFGERWHSLLQGLEFGSSRGLIVSEENFAGLRPSRNSAEGYGAVPELATTVVNMVRDRFWGEEIDITVYLSLRQRGSWLRSLWAHDLQRTRLTLDLDEFRSNLDHLPSLRETANDIRTALPSITVHTEWLEEQRERRFGPGTPFADFLKLPREKSAKLVPPKKANIGLPEDVLTELLTLNRSALDEATLTAQKKALIKSATKDLTRQT